MGDLAHFEAVQRLFEQDIYNDPSSRMSLDDMYATVKAVGFFQDHADCIKYEHGDIRREVSVFSPR